MKCIQCEKKIIGRNVKCSHCCSQDKKRICYQCGTQALELNIIAPICPYIQCQATWTTEFIESTFSKTLLTKLRKTKEVELKTPSRINSVKKVHEDSLKKYKEKMLKAKKRIEQLEVEKQLLDQEMLKITELMKGTDIKSASSAPNSKKSVKRRLDFEDPLMKVDQTLEEIKCDMEDL